MRYTILKRLLFLLLSFIAVTAMVSGLLLMIRPNGELLHLPLSLIEGTIFRSFLVPGILLCTIVGGTNFIAAFQNFQKKSNRYNWAMAGGYITSGWIIAQIIIIYTVHWLHILYLAMGISIILLAYQLKGKWAV